MGMTQEEHTQRHSNSSGGDGGGSSSSRSSKRLKEKKVPQRGLGVAQLEKIRLEEQQQKKESSISSPISFLPPSNSSPNFRHNPSPSLVPSPPPPLQTDLSSPVFIQDCSIPSVDFLHPNAFALSNPSEGDGGEIGWPLVAGLGQGYLPKFWNGDYYLEQEKQGLAFGLNVKSNFESKPVWAPKMVVRRAQQIQLRPPSTSLSLVNVSSGTSSLSGIDFAHMEPPSNQSFHGKNSTPVWSDEEKMVGRKRSYPFTLDNVPGLSFPCKIPTNRSNEPSSSNGNGGPVNVEFNNPVFSNLFREGSSSSSALLELNPKKATMEKEDLNGDFLTLAPPTMVMPRPGSTSNHPLLFLNPQHSHELPDFESLPFQGSVAAPIYQPGPSGSMQHQAFYTFYPPAKARIGLITTGVSGSGSGAGENLDLNLKL